MENSEADRDLYRDPILKIVLSETGSYGEKAIVVEFALMDRNGAIVRSWPLSGGVLGAAGVNDLVGWLDERIINALDYRAFTEQEMFPETTS